MAGESARESARRQREKADRLARAAAMYEKGADGEEATAACLALLPKDQFTVFHDVRWPGRRYANIDHVVVGPGGVFVIDSKNWSGRIKVDNGVLRQNGRQRETTVAGAAEAALAVARLVTVVDVNHVMPVLCFVRDEKLAGWSRDVMVCSTGNIGELLTTRRVVLSAADRLEASMQLDAQFRAAGVTTGSVPQPAARSGAYAVAPPQRTPAVNHSRREPPRGSRAPRQSRKSKVPRFKLVFIATFAGLILLRPDLWQAGSRAAGEWLADRFTSGLEQPDPTPTPKPSAPPPAAPTR